MIQRKIGTALASCGVVMLMFGLSALPAHGAAPAHVLLQPSPRPAIEPLKHRHGAAIAMGHITGTVIDLRTGAPAAGVIVNVADTQVTTDANGNYDRWLPVGDYLVALQLSGEQGVAAQGELTVVVQAAAPTVQHLTFRSAEPALATPAPQAAADAPAPVATAAPAAPANQAAPEAAPAAPKMAPAATLKAPNRLPRTGSEASAAWLWLAFGMFLLLGGGLVGFGPLMNGRSAAALIRTHAANRQLIQALLSQPARDELLQALFQAHDRRHR